MKKFEEILTASSEGLLKTLYRTISRKNNDTNSSAQDYARFLGLTYAQMVCAMGFNPQIRELPDVTEIIGFATYDDLARERNESFVNDIYDRLAIKDVLAIYTHVPHHREMLALMQYLLPTRIGNIETRIEETINSVVIERYKKEMRAVYNDHVAQIEFAELRISDTQSGFRALVNEVILIADSRLLPIGDLFFRDTVLPEEKRRLIDKGLVPRELVEQRLTDASLGAQERKILEEQVRLFL